MRLLIKVEGSTSRRVRHHREVQQRWKITGAQKLKASWLRS